MQAESTWSALHRRILDGIEERAYALGAEHGRAAASWYFDGNTPREAYERTLRGILECDPAVFDTFPSSPLSGEWADDPLPRDILEQLGLREGSEHGKHALNLYEDGYGVAVADEIERACRAQLEPEGSE